MRKSNIISDITSDIEKTQSAISQIEAIPTRQVDSSLLDFARKYVAFLKDNIDLLEDLKKSNEQQQQLEDYTYASAFLIEVLLRDLRDALGGSFDFLQAMQKLDEEQQLIQKLLDEKTNEERSLSAERDRIKLNLQTKFGEKFIK